MDKYEISAHKQVRYRRRQRGLANVQYLRYERDFLLLATPGQHRWFKEEQQSIRDVRRVPIVFGDYSIRLTPGNYLRKKPGAKRAQVDGKLRVRVIIRRRRIRQVKRELLAAAAGDNVDELIARFRELPFEPYAPVRRQLFSLLRQVNSLRRQQGLAAVPTTAS